MMFDTYNAESILFIFYIAKCAYVYIVKLCLHQEELGRGPWVMLRILLLGFFRETNTRCTNTRVQSGPKNWHTFLCALTSPGLTSSNIDRFSNSFHCLNQKNVCSNNVTKDLISPKVCRYTMLWNVSVLKATIENKTTSVTTPFKKLITGNNVFIVCYYLKQLSHPAVFTSNV